MAEKVQIPTQAGVLRYGLNFGKMETCLLIDFTAC